MATRKERSQDSVTRAMTKHDVDRFLRHSHISYKYCSGQKSPPSHRLECDRIYSSFHPTSIKRALPLPRPASVRQYRLLLRHSNGNDFLASSRLQDLMRTSEHLLMVRARSMALLDTTEVHIASTAPSHLQSRQSSSRPFEALPQHLHSAN